MRPTRLLAALTLILAGVVIGGTALAQSGPDPVVVIEVGDPMDQRLIDYVESSLAAESAHLFILKIDSPGVSSGDLTSLFDTVLATPAPVVAWVGPHPAVAYGGSAYLVNHADLRSAAPGAIVGYLDPAVHRGDSIPPSTRPGDDTEAFVAMETQLAETTVTVGGEHSTVVGFVDRIDPALGQLIVSLDGITVARGDSTFEIDTARSETVQGQNVVVQSRPVTFIKPGIVDRALRLGARPETAFLFLVLGLSFAVFEFYAAGAGLMASVAGMSLILSGYGLATLPIWWPAVAMTLLGLSLLVWGFVQNRVDWRAVLGTILVLAGGLTFTATRPQYPPSLSMVLFATSASVLFIWYSLTTVVRGRFATPTVGREAMIGRRCLAVSDLDPLGVVLVDGARWRATTDRGVEASAGAPLEIVGVTGLLLEVDPVGTPTREDFG